LGLIEMKERSISSRAMKFMRTMRIENHRTRYTAIGRAPDDAPAPTGSPAVNTAG
jgi:hypothetical protein